MAGPKTLKWLYSSHGQCSASYGPRQGKYKQTSHAPARQYKPRLILPSHADNPYLLALVHTCSSVY